MSTTTLHYIYDPLCGWCYGAAPLVKAAREVLPVQAHGGGMMAGDRRQPVTPQLRDYVMPHDRRIANATSQPFGAAYFEGLLRDTSAVFDSAPPTAAVLAAERLAGRGLDMLSRLQSAHYVEGRRIADREVLVAMAGAIGLDATAFALALDEAQGEQLHSHIAETRRLMERVGARGFPSFALERDSKFTLLDAGAFLGRPQELRDWLKTQLPDEVAAPASAAAEFGCGPDSCSI
ncbi:DsbA family protein [Rugamonas sp. A1-17]|nr:DsbA family protein [Rugamonas sp. A1-17]